MSQHEQFCQLAECDVAPDAHSASDQYCAYAATATAISNPGKKRYQV